MSIPYPQFEMAKKINAGLAIVRESRRRLATPGGLISRIVGLFATGSRTEVRVVDAVALQIMGIRGSSRGGHGERQIVKYTLLFDLAEPDRRIPTAWVLHPSNDEICHVNIFPPSHCELTQAPFPRLCWGVDNHKSYSGMWINKLSHSQRTLSQLIEFTKQFLNTENPDSPAR